MVRAAREESDERVAEEAADLLYHLERPARLARGAAVRARWRCSMAVAAESELTARAEPRGGARARRARATWSRSAPRLRRRLRDARLRLPQAARGEPEGAPCFLLESAEQGQVGRYSFVGFRPRSVLRWGDGDAERSDGATARTRPSDAPDPYGAVAERLAALRARRRSRACRRSPAAPSASSATTWCARSSRSASRTPTRSGCPTWR